MRITGRVLGAQEVAKRFRAFREEVPDIIDREGLETFLLKRMRQRFDAQVSPDGRPWAKLKPITIRLRKFPGRPLLVQTGELRKALGVAKGGQTGFLSNTGFGFRIGILSRRRTQYNPLTRKTESVDTAEYGRELQEGRENMEPRPIVGINSADVTILFGNMRRRMKRAEARFNK